MLMKKAMATCLSALLLIGCGNGNSSASAPQSSASAQASNDVTASKTIGDIYALNPDVQERGNTEDTYFMVFFLDNTLYRAYADLSKDTLDQLMALEFDDPDYDTRYIEIASPLKIRQFDNLSEMIPTQEELNQWVGKTGQDLLDDGWTEGYGYNLEDMDFYLYKGPFCYVVRFEKDKEYKNTDDFDVQATIAPLTIVSVTYNGPGNGSEM